MTDLDELTVIEQYAIPRKLMRSFEFYEKVRIRGKLGTLKIMLKGRWYDYKHTISI